MFIFSIINKSTTPDMVYKHHNTYLSRKAKPAGISGTTDLDSTTIKR